MDKTKVVAELPTDLVVRIQEEMRAKYWNTQTQALIEIIKEYFKKIDLIPNNKEQSST